MPGKNRVSQIIEMKAATLILISLTMKLGFILTPLNHFLIDTLGAAYPLRVLGHLILHLCRKSARYLRLPPVVQRFDGGTLGHLTVV